MTIKLNISCFFFLYSHYCIIVTCVQFYVFVIRLYLVFYSQQCNSPGHFLNLSIYLFSSARCSYQSCSFSPQLNFSVSPFFFAVPFPSSSALYLHVSILDLSSCVFTSIIHASFAHSSTVHATSDIEEILLNTTDSEIYIWHDEARN